MFSEFSCIFENTVFKKNVRREIVSSIPRKILKCDIKSYYKKISKIFNVLFISQRLKTEFKKQTEYFYLVLNEFADFSEYI